MNNIIYKFLRKMYTSIYIYIEKWIYNYIVVRINHIRVNYSKIEQKALQDDLIVSLTAIPSRIDKLQIVIESILSQSLHPAKIIITLYIYEFKNIKFSTELSNIIERNNIEILWVDENLMPHKKYFYAMQKYPSSTIITIDDDCILKRNLIKDLYETSQKYPSNIVCTRAHLIKYDEYGNLLPYKQWEYETCHFLEPSCDFLATGVGGVLYPPHSLPRITFDKKLILELCLKADDIWLKAMETVNHKEIVIVPHVKDYVVGIYDAEEINLMNDNVANNKNDYYIKKVFSYFKINNI